MLKTSILALIVLLAGTALAVNEPHGFGKAMFGMNPDAVRADYPDMEVLDRSLGAAQVKSPFVKTFVVHAQTIEGLPKPVEVELRFWKDQLWVVVVHFSGNDVAAVEKSLRTQIELPEDQRLPWRGEHATVVFTPKAKWYSIHDNAISKDAQAAFMEDLRRGVERRGAHGQAAKQPPAGVAAPQP